MMRHAALFALLALPSVMFAADKKDAPTEFRGSVADADLMKQAPASGVITSAKGLEKLAKAWKIDAPKVDFEKNVVVIGVTRGSRINGRPQLKDGDLKALFIATRDLGEGFRYVMIVHPREGIKTVNGKELPKE